MRLGAVIGGSTTVTFGQLNLWNWFDTVNDPRTQDTVYTREQYDARRAKLAKVILEELKSPDVLTLQEVENAAVLDDILAMPEIAALGYRYVLGDRADVRGIRNAILYRASRLELGSVSQPNPLSTLPPEQPGLAAPLLFSRPPIVASFTQIGAGGAAAGAAFTVIDNHFLSKIGGPVHEPRRRAQGAFIGGLVDAMRGADPSVPVLVVGDLNATYADGAYQAIERRPDGSQRMVDSVARLPEEDRYSYIYNGSKDLLDHLMVTPDLADSIEAVRILHIGSGAGSEARRFDPTTSFGISDHDAVLATIRLVAPSPSVRPRYVRW